MMYGVIDIGSNTIRLNIYHVYKSGFKLILKNKIPTGLANYIESGKMNKSGIELAGKVLKELRITCESLGIENILAFATAPLRNISNSEYAQKTIEDISGLKIDVISGEDEGTLSYKGAIYDVQLIEGLAVDIGGGSTELVFFEDEKIDYITSLEIGSLNTFNNFVSGIIPDKKELKLIKKKSEGEISKNISYKAKDKMKLVGVGGTLRACLKINNYLHDYDSSNNEITIKELDEILETLSGDFDKAKSILLRNVPERIHTLMPGIRILKTITKYFDINTIYVSEFGVREGFLAKYLEKNNVLNAKNNNILDLNMVNDNISLQKKIEKHAEHKD